MRKIKEVLRLKFEVKLSHAQIAAALSLSKGVVTKYAGLAAIAGLDWPAIKSLDEATLERQLLATPAKPLTYVQPDYGCLHQALRRKGMTLMLLWEEHRAYHADPMTGRPDVRLPDEWDEIPGARGCTPQSCSYKDYYKELKAIGSEVFGLSTQSTLYQKEMVERLHLPFLVLSDSNLEFQSALNLPTFEVAGMTLLKRLTMIIKSGVIVAVHYPVFPSDSDPSWVLHYLKNNN